VEDVKKRNGETEFITFEYEAHSKLFTLLFQAIDKGLLIE